MTTTMFTSDNGDRDGVPNLAVMVTDGNSNIQAEMTFLEASKAKLAGVEVYVVWLGTGKRGNAMEEVTGIASRPTDQHIELLSDASNIPQVTDELLNNLCQSA